MHRALAVVLAALVATSAAPVRADGWTELRWAVYSGKEADLVRLLDGGVNIDLRNEEGWTALHVAAEQGNLRIVNYLLTRGADPNLKTTRGKTAYDVSEGYAEVRRALKARMAPVADPFQGAAPQPDRGVARRPVAADDRSRNGADGRSASMRPRLEARDAVWYNNKGELTELLDGGLDVNMLDEAGRETLLHAAAWRDRLDIARLLLDRGADRNIRDKDGKLPLDYAQSAEMRALLGPRARAGRTPLPSSPSKGDDHCKKVWDQDRMLCGFGAYSCNIKAANRYQACLKSGR